MNDMSPARRRELKALAHHLDPVVSISGNGLSESVLKEIEVALNAHELIKIRVFGDDREQRQAYLKSICEHTGAAAVQSIGKLLVLWRAAPAKAEDKPAAKPWRGKPLTKRAAQARLEHPTKARKSRPTTARPAAPANKPARRTAAPRRRP